MSRIAYVNGRYVPHREPAYISRTAAINLAMAFTRSAKFTMAR